MIYPIDSIEGRAFNAYFRKFGKDAMQPSQDVEIYEENNETFVELSNVNGTLAVFKVCPQTLRFVDNPELYERKF